MVGALVGGSKMLTLKEIVNLVGESFLTEDHKITVTGTGNMPYRRGRHFIVFFDKEERGDIGRYLFHQPQQKVASLHNFDRFYYSQRIIE